MAEEHRQKAGDIISSGVDVTKDEIASAHIMSDDLREILTRMPHWIVRWGLSSLLVVILMVLTLSWFIKYPDIIAADIEITSSVPPVSLVAQSSGRIKKLLVADQQAVSKGDYLVILENTADYEMVLAAKVALFEVISGVDHLAGYTIGKLDVSIVPLKGDLQPAYEVYESTRRRCQEFVDLQYYGTKLALTRDQHVDQQLLRNELEKRLETLKEEYAINQAKNERMRKMFESSIITRSEYDDFRSILLGKKSDLEGEKADLADVDRDLKQLELTIFELQHDSLSTYHRLAEEYRNSTENLMNAILTWEKRYVLIAPMDGVVSLTSFWAEDQYVTAGEKVLSVLPDEPLTLVGKVKLPIEGSGKVVPNQHVNIKLSNYPYSEFGTVAGIVQTKSLVPDENNYVLTVSFPDNLVTNQGVELQFSQKLTGTAEIVTNDSRLIERFFRQTKTLFD